MAERFNDQNYSKLRKHHQDLGLPWSDPIFPANESSIGLEKAKELPRNIEWKRPHEITKQPSLFVDGASGHDATQGRLGNCWFVAACSVLAGKKPLWERVIPDWKDQEWSEDNEYSGIFRFQFWRFGKWVEVCVDDQLPTYNGELLFSHSKDNNEFWGALLEKAYAKLHGTYEVLDGGNLSDALVDFTSGVSEVIEIDSEVNGYRTDDFEKKKCFFKSLITEMEDHALMCCAVKATSSAEMEQRTDLGLVKGHAYGITALKKVPLGGTNLSNLFKGREKLYLIRLQNPWGQKEWTGPFGDKSPEWSNISEKEREKLGLTFDDDGEFWMPFDDFLHQFTDMSICRVINTSVFSFSKTWCEEQLFDSWKKSDIEDRAGGCLNHPETFLNNPQYRFDISKEEDEIIVQLSQEDCRDKLVEKRKLLVIGFHIMKVEENRKYRVHKTQEGICNSDYILSKHIFLKTTLKKGRYVIIPTTLNPGESRNFLLRIFTDSDANVQKLEKHFPVPAWWKCCASPPTLLTKVTVKGASGLQNSDTFSQSDPYCIVNCEGKKVRSLVRTDDLSPEWNCKAIFFRKNPEKPIKIQIWNHNLVMDSFMGQALALAPNSEPSTLVLNLTGKGSKNSEILPGHVTVEVETYDDLKTL
ncbi:calpain-5-like isoform X2 [Tigriopus californicus]|nr:calpain-5-like isoform X2 [Tigriopus californicus]